MRKYIVVCLSLLCIFSAGCGHCAYTAEYTEAAEATSLSDYDEIINGDAPIYLNLVDDELMNSRLSMLDRTGSYYIDELTNALAAAAKRQVLPEPGGIYRAQLNLGHDDSIELGIQIWLRDTTGKYEDNSLELIVKQIKGKAELIYITELGSHIHDTRGLTGTGSWDGDIYRDYSMYIDSMGRENIIYERTQQYGFNARSVFGYILPPGEMPMEIPDNNRVIIDCYDFDVNDHSSMELRDKLKACKFLINTDPDTYDIYQKLLIELGLQVITEEELLEILYDRYGRIGFLEAVTVDYHEPYPFAPQWIPLTE